MHVIDNSYRVNDTNNIFLAKNAKVILRGIIKYKNLGEIHAGIVEVLKGPEYRHTDEKDFDFVERSEKLDGDTKIMFIPLHSLSTYDDDDIIVYGLSTKWNVWRTDWYKQYRLEHMAKYGYDIHDRVYNLPKASSNKPVTSSEG